MDRALASNAVFGSFDFGYKWRFDKGTLSNWIGWSLRFHGKKLQESERALKTFSGCERAAKTILKSVLHSGLESCHPKLISFTSTFNGWPHSTDAELIKEVKTFVIPYVFDSGQKLRYLSDYH